MQIYIEEVRGIPTRTDGTHVYWIDNHRVRWALIDWPNDGVGVRTHGAALSLELAMQDAWERQAERNA
jgi:hypothetical protein